jgi:structural maintenance of chromosome 2
MDLIYKRWVCVQGQQLTPSGQAGVTKASVTIVFNNQDRSKSPLGFENTPQITVTRQIAVGNVSKYLLNGHKSTLQTIQNLFQSVQLNINNPNFLIMQGKITKVLNMKPAEILGMVEEAAGTRMFEDRKDKAIKTMAKKDKKVEEIKSVSGKCVPVLTSSSCAKKLSPSSKSCALRSGRISSTRRLRPSLNASRASSRRTSGR